MFGFYKLVCSNCFQSDQLAPEEKRRLLSICTKYAIWYHGNKEADEAAHSTQISLLSREIEPVGLLSLQDQR